jgi:uncharacterized protein (DUF305 family)
MNATTSRLSRLLGAGFLAATVVLAGCSNDSDSAHGSGRAHSSTSSSESAPTAAPSVEKIHNAADVTFAQEMIVHHRGAVEMADMAAAQAESQEVKDLAKRISAAQGPEIDQMTDWLNTWGEMTSGHSMPGMEHSSMPGMMTEEQMGELKDATGRDFDRMFLQMMTEHHEGAVAMAKTEQADGRNPRAIELAESIETSKTAEIAEMAEMLKGV